MSGKRRQGRQAAQQANLWIENHPLRNKPEWYTCYAHICGQIQKIRVMGHYPNMGRGNVYLDRFPLDNGPMFSSYVEYASIEVLGETLPEDAQEAPPASRPRSSRETDSRTATNKATPASKKEQTTMLTIIHYYEPDAVMHWLEFPGKPDAATRDILKAVGWRFIGAVMQWRHAGLLTPLPELPGYEYEEGGEVDYSQDRAEHYEDRAEKAEARRAAAHQKADTIADMIPFGQPILVGHHSERRHRRDLAKIDKNMRTAIEEGRKAERLRDRAEASLAQQERKHNPGAIARRLEGLRKDYRLYGQATSAEGIRRRDLLATEIKRLEAELEEAGGLPADHIALQKGDLIVIEGHIVEVIRVNRKTITGYLASPIHNLYSKESGYTKRTKRSSGQHDRTRFRLRIYTAQEWAAVNEGRNQAEAYAIAEASLREMRQAEHQASEEANGDAPEE